MREGPRQAAPASSHWPAWVRYLLYFLVAAGLALYLSRRSDGPERGELAAPFVLPIVGEATGSFDSRAQGRPLLVEVFASWCSSCRRAAPMLAKLSEEYGAAVQFVGVSVDDSAAAALQARRSWRIPYPVVHDDGSVARGYGISAVPTIVLVDAQGRVARSSSGLPGRATLAAWLDEAVAE